MKKVKLATAVAIVGLLLAGLLYFRQGIPERSEPGQVDAVSVAQKDAPIRLRLQSFALMLHPLKMADVESRQVATTLYAGLVVQDQDDGTLPAAAESWTQDGNIWEFRLRPGLSFSNGQSLREADVVSSLCNAMQPESTWAWALASIRHQLTEDGKRLECTGITVPEPGVIRIAVESQLPWFLDAIGGPAGWILPADGATEAAFGVMPGLGPYTVKAVIPDNRIELLPRTDGAAIQPLASAVQFDLIIDDAVAAAAFSGGTLDVLDLSSPRLIEMLVDPQSGKLNRAGVLQTREWDRVRIAVINENRLLAKGLGPDQVRQFVGAYSASVDRDRLASLSKGGAVALYSPFPPLPLDAVESVSADGLPAVNLTVITEQDSYSDMIAATLPKSVGSVTTRYRGTDKGVLIQSLVSGEFDIASILIEATTRSPEFWKSFFTPGNAFTAFGKPIPGLEQIDQRGRYAVLFRGTGAQPADR